MKINSLQRFYHPECPPRRNLEFLIKFPAHTFFEMILSNNLFCYFCQGLYSKESKSDLYYGEFLYEYKCENYESFVNARKELYDSFQSYI